jgi:competence protein ComEC
MPVLFAGALLVLVSGGAVAGWVSLLLDAVLGPLMAWLQWVEQLAAPVSEITPEASPLLLAILAAVVVALLRFPDRVFRLMTVALVGAWAAMAVLTRPAAVNPEVVAPEIRVWDVGQGLSVLVRVGRKALVYDTGPEVRGVFSAVDSTLLPNLRALGINRLDRLVISHGDSDHAGGLVQLVQAVEVGQIQSGEPEVVAGILDDVPGASVKGCWSEPFEWHGMVFEFWESRAERTGNDASCVVRVHHAASGSDVLLTGDISKRVEAEMLAPGAVPWLRKAVDFRLVLAPHHGSKTSSSAPWVNLVAPDWVIYTAGYRHRYGHPHPDVVARYRLAGARPLNTACSGEIVITLSEHGPQISELRHTAPFWIQGPGLTRDQCKIP